jgi:hypothetical protein
MLAATGRDDEAATRMERAAARGFTDVPDDAGWPMAISLFAETAIIVEDRRAATALGEILQPFARDRSLLITGGIAFGPATRLLALVQNLMEQHGAADQHFAAAIEDAERLESPIWSARCRLDWAEHLLERNETSRAYELLDDADAVLRDRDLPALQRQLRHLRA